MIRLRTLTKEFGSRLAVDGLDLQVPRGEIHGLPGHHGAGKSTAIGMMLGQVWPISGVVEVCGHDVTRARQAALQRIGAIFESPVLGSISGSSCSPSTSRGRASLSSSASWLDST